MITYNRVKILATAGPACQDPEILDKMIKAGVDVFRLNMSHSDRETHVAFVQKLRRLSQHLNVYVSILVDLQGPKMRVGNLAKPLSIYPGQEITFSLYPDTLDEVLVEYDTFPRDVEKGTTVLIEDGKVELQVLETDKKHRVRAVVVRGEKIASRKGINLPRRPISLPTLSNKDWEDIQFAVREQVDWVAISFVRHEKDVYQVRRYLESYNVATRIISKIERPEALERIEPIIDASDGIMVARGDLGVEIPLPEVPLWQKKIIRLCNQAGKPVIVATQMLETMIENPMPTRAEVTDVANAVLDGADAVMLSGETSVGKYPLEAVMVMQEIVAQAEKDPHVYSRPYDVNPDSPTYLSDAIGWTACQLAEQVGARALIGMTYSGYTAFQLARWRPQADIYIFTRNTRILPVLNLIWGVRAFYYNRHQGTHQTIEDVIQILKDLGCLHTGDIVINTATLPLASRLRTNMIKISTVP
ncbi:MAG: pyruvate kinase [Bacteroidia bacterium]